MVTFYVYFFLVFASISRLKADLIFTSPLKTKSLFISIDKVIETLEKYIQTEEDQLESLKCSLDEWVSEHENYAENVETELSNHLSQFNFLSKLKQRWTEFKTNDNTALEYISQMKINTTWPSDDDMFGIMDSIINLQNIHFMKAEKFAKGELNGVVTNTSLDYKECFMMAARCFETVHYKYALQWALVTLEKYTSERIENEQQLSRLLYYISYSSHVTGDDDLAFESITKYMEKNPHNRKGKQLQDVIYHKHPEKLENNAKKKFEISQQIKNLCKMSTTQNELSHANHLRCRYKTRDSQFLTIAPLKEELLSLNPPLLVYRDILYDSEIYHLKDKAKDRLQSAGTSQSSSHQNNAIEIVHFADDEDDKLSNLNLKVQDMAFLPINSKNGYRMHKFTAGGSYTHEEENRENDDEDVTITVIFHMNDVMRGGSTIFPRANITVKAEKGDALIWYDLPDNRPNDLPKYSSCSVLAGQKWTLTTWTNS